MERASIGRLTRRELVARGLAVGAAASGGAEVQAAGAAQHPAGDAAVLRETLALELLLVFVYRGVLGSATLTSRQARIVRELLAHEQAHARALTGELKQIGQNPPRGPASVAAADAELAARGVSGGLANLNSQRDSLRLLLGAEGAAEGVYYRALTRLSAPEHIQLAAEIMAAEAQHATILSQLLRPGDIDMAVPNAFVQGKS